MRTREMPDAVDAGRKMLASERSPLTAKQERAIAELLARPTLEAAADAVGVTALTLRRWRRDPLFSGAYRQARRDAQDQAAGRLRLLAGTAVQALADVLADPETRDADRIRAAAVVLDLAFRDSWRDPEMPGIDPIRITVSFSDPEVCP